jgi:transposase InsO family protein
VNRALAPTMVRALSTTLDHPAASGYEVVDQFAHQCSIVALCLALGVSRSGFYAWRSRRSRHREENPRAGVTEALRVAIRACHARSRGTYGSPRVYADLVAQGIRCSRRHVARLMASLALRSRRVVGWSMSDILDATLTGDALRMALGRRRPHHVQGLNHHSDRGSTYTAASFQALLREAGITCSMGRPGTCLDNAVAETFFATLKVELVHRRRWSTQAKAVSAIFAYVETWYCSHWRHGILGYVSLVAFEAATSLPAPAA